MFTDPFLSTIPTLISSSPILEGRRPLLLLGFLITLINFLFPVMPVEIPILGRTMIMVYGPCGASFLPTDI